TGKDKGKMGTSGERKSSQIFCFTLNSVNKRKMALVHAHQSRFVYSLRDGISLFYLFILFFSLVLSFLLFFFSFFSRKRKRRKGKGRLH
ncbi:MAG: hypothetical protein J6D08_05000, partial [Lachnospiraceae bacterium]|nr:hypothetical protein [Lachnospiraceae bacterium]